MYEVAPDYCSSLISHHALSPILNSSYTGILSVCQNLHVLSTTGPFHMLFPCSKVPVSSLFAVNSYSLLRSQLSAASLEKPFQTTALSLGCVSFLFDFKECTNLSISVLVYEFISVNIWLLSNALAKSSIHTGTASILLSPVTFNIE